MQISNGQPAVAWLKFAAAALAMTAEAAGGADALASVMAATRSAR